MCGIAGFIDPRRPPAEALERKALGMADRMRRRGPDHRAGWADATAGVGLGHARLSIIDLSNAAHQPMVSACGRFCLVYNGEVYNFRELRAELAAAGEQFRTSSDTEVLLLACMHFGVEQAVRRLVGMFAFALWDKQERTLAVARDRLGIKPLYYGTLDGCFVFGSELKPLSPWLANAHLDPTAISLLVRHGYIGAPYSIFKQLRKLPPGTTLTVKADAPATWAASPRTYWSAAEVAISGAEQQLTGSAAEICEQLLATLRTAVHSRLVADVPLGAFLSGGIDSSLVTALMKEAHSHVRTFSIGFSEAEFDESRHAARVAAHLGTDHTQFHVNAEDAAALLPQLPSLWDEPFADSSQIPTYLVCKLARQYVTVALTGDGGDELFCGYTRYANASRWWNALRRVPAPLRQLAAQLPRRERLVNQALRWVPNSLEPWRLRNRALRAADLVDAKDEQEFYRSFVSLWEEPSGLLQHPVYHRPAMGEAHTWASLPTSEERMMAADLVSYLPGDILTKVDRASMGASLEARVPLLDHRLVEFAARIPLEFKQRDGQGKWVLRQLLARYIPKELFERNKQGFAIPLDHWLRGPLREWAESTLSSRLEQDGVFNMKAVQNIWADHIGHRRGAESLIWNVLMFQTWLDNWNTEHGFRPGFA